ncbi:hypothetical protein KY290_025418 [Solanum tuberosum]|uniref:DUF7722 domain-containing protein n=1 Tax=Solanum tuberosum TaxID=4113 RepID=A0ABQ7UTN2_SOLTU|nr:hypothetical protein KY289_024488 [Solanum tuberosum]KAH0676345.1 hypothetical protein KY285_024146 [Solanum tuberosum]KAH0755148.1 hypothetical protein KY290_025418 [Solanum tuberosum]
MSGVGVESMARSNGGARCVGIENNKVSCRSMESMARSNDCGGIGFQMPLHYPKYTKAEYESMAEWKVDCLLTQYGLPIHGDVNHKRKFAMGAFLWTY